MFFLAAGASIIVVLGWFVLRYAMGNSGHDGGAFFLLNGFVIVVIGFIAIMTYLLVTNV